MVYLNLNTLALFLMETYFPPVKQKIEIIVCMCDTYNAISPDSILVTYIIKLIRICIRSIYGNVMQNSHTVMLTT